MLNQDSQLVVIIAEHGALLENSVQIYAQLEQTVYILIVIVCGGRVQINFGQLFHALVTLP